LMPEGAEVPQSFLKLLPNKACLAFHLFIS
jgi:hypothetical protein